MFMGVWKTRLSPEEAEGAIDEGIAWFEQRGAPYFFWWMDPQTQPADLVGRLLKRGFGGCVQRKPPDIRSS